MTIRFLDPKELDAVQESINNDEEFRIAAKYFTNDVLFTVGEDQAIVQVREGVVSDIFLEPTFMDPWQFCIKASREAWEKFLQPTPPPMYNALFPAMIRQIFKVEGDLEKAFAHFWPITRMMDILREIQN